MCRNRKNVLRDTDYLWGAQLTWLLDDVGHPAGLAPPGGQQREHLPVHQRAGQGALLQDALAAGGRCVPEVLELGLGFLGAWAGQGALFKMRWLPEGGACLQLQ